jgi:SAM-dependent methyltransferase
MDKWWILSASEFYTQIIAYMRSVDPSWAEDWLSGDPEEGATLRAILGEGDGRSVLDCSCGSGAQAIPLARMGWQVTGTDITEAHLSEAKRRAETEGLPIEFAACDMRDLGQHYRESYDWVISCWALDNITEDEGIRATVRGMYEALRPGGRCYLRWRNFDDIMEEMPRYEFKGEHRTPHGRAIRIEDWDYESETHVVHLYILWHEDERKKETTWSRGWDWTVLGMRRRALRAAELEQFLRDAGFVSIGLRPKSGAWEPHEVIATKRGGLS